MACRTLLVFLLVLVAVPASSIPSVAMEPPRFMLACGQPGSSPGQFSYPQQAAVDAAGNVYVADRGNSRIQKYAPDGAFLMSIGSPGTGAGRLNGPSGVAIDAAGNIVVADTRNHRIQRFSSTGTFLNAWGTLGPGDTQFDNPYGVAVAANDEIVVVDRGNHRIKVFDATGSLLRHWGGLGSTEGLFYEPSAVAVSSHGVVYVTDEFNHRVQVFTLGGIYRYAWGEPSQSVFTTPHGVAVDENGIVYVTDERHRVQVFDPSGRRVAVWGSEGSGEGQFRSPVGIAVAPGELVYVVDPGNYRFQKFGVREPVVLSVRDVGNDQGRLVRLTFQGSGRDTVGSAEIASYEVFRRVEGGAALPPVQAAAALSGWEFVGEVPAHRETEYNALVPTVVDSTASGGVAWSAYFVRAATGDPGVFYDSPVDSGYSLDNLVPGMPEGLRYEAPGFLVWDPPADPDIQYYTVSCDQASGATYFSDVTDTRADVRGSGCPRFRVNAVDFAGNSGPGATVQNPVPVRLTHFTAARQGSAVRLSWGVAEATDHAGFEVHRELEGERVRVSSFLSGRASYDFEDVSAPAGPVDYWLAEIARDGALSWHGPISVGAAALAFTSRVGPNPFTAATTITFALPEPARARVLVLDAQGRVVTVLLDEAREAGEQVVTWDGRAMGVAAPAGQYFVRVEAGDRVTAGKVLLVR